MIFMTEILYLVFVIFIKEAIAQFQMHACMHDTLDRLHYFIMTNIKLLGEKLRDEF